MILPHFPRLTLPTHEHLLQLPGTNKHLKHPIWDWLSLLPAILTGTSHQWDCHLMLPLSSKHHGGSGHSQHSTHQCDDGWTSATNSNFSPPINCKSSSWFLAYIVWIRTKPQYYWDTSKCNKYNSTDPRSPYQLGEHLLVSRFMKGFFHLRPPQPRYIKTWDIDKVLSYLKSLGPNDSLRLTQLTLKTAALLTILGGLKL